MGAFSGPETVDVGIVLGLDAANTRSYVGSGTTWTDLVGSNNGTLINGPVFTQEPKQEPFGGAGAVAFDGTGDTLTLANNADHQFGSSDYTIESWVYLNNLSTVQGLFGRYNTSSAREIYITLNTNGSITHRTSSNGTSFSTHTSSTGLLTANTWHHVAISKSGTNSYIAVDGVVGSGTVDSTLHTASQTTYIGDAVAGSNLLNGNLSNYRILKGTALYTSNFTPKRQPLLPESAPNTVLLTCQKGTIKDRSSSAHAITINGDAKSISGASYFEFDGTDDNCSLGPSSDFTPGTGPFTIEMWIYPTATPSQYEGPAHYTGSGVNLTSLFWAYRSGSLDLINNGDNYTLLSMTYPTLNQWVHLVASRDASGYFAVYENGVVKASTTGNSDNYEQTEIYIGGSGAYKWPGKVSIFKMYKGKGLTAAEVKQNYRNTKGRYGL